MTFKKIVGKIHLWPGLASGLIVFIVGLTGCLLAFEEEISRLLNYGIYQPIVKKDAPPAAPSAVFKVSDSVLQGRHIHQSYYAVFTSEPRVNVLWALDSTRQYHAVLQNPYTAAVEGSYQYKQSFFAIMTHIHVSLALGDVGGTIIKYAVLIFVIMMITGIILWKPASKKGYKQRFTIKWNAKGKRLNYDLHNVLGFYMSWVAVFIALTGLVWSFEWMNDSMQWVANGGKKLPPDKQKIVSDSTLVKEGKWVVNNKVMDSVYFALLQVVKNDINSISVYKPTTKTDAIRLVVETRQGANYLRTDKYFYDQYNGKLIAVQKFAGLSNGEKMRHINYYIHVGSIAGLTGKILAFFASLIAASLPISGFIIWKGRKKRKAPAAGMTEVSFK